MLELRCDEVVLVTSAYRGRLYTFHDQYWRSRSPTPVSVLTVLSWDYFSSGLNGTSKYPIASRFRVVVLLVLLRRRICLVPSPRKPFFLSLLGSLRIREYHIVDYVRAVAYKEKTGV